MAIAKNGINGKFTGKVGSVVGYQLGDQNIIRTVGERKKPFSQLELLNQKKMKVTSEFLSQIRHYLKFGFQREVPIGSRIGAFQLAQSYIRKNAIELDTEGQPYINPEKVLISKGPLAPPNRCTVERDGNRLTFQWDASNQGGWGDRLMILLYDMDIFRDFREIGARRKDQIDVWENDSLQSTNKPVHVYVAFRDTLFDTISDSVYCGVV